MRMIFVFMGSQTNVYVCHILTTPKANSGFANDQLFLSERLVGLWGPRVTQVGIITFLKVNLSPGWISEIT